MFEACRSLDSSSRRIIPKFSAPHCCFYFTTASPWCTSALRREWRTPGFNRSCNKSDTCEIKTHRHMKNKEKRRLLMIAPVWVYKKKKNLFFSHFKSKYLEEFLLLFLVLFQLGQNIHVVRIHNPGCLYLAVTTSIGNGLIFTSISRKFSAIKMGGMRKVLVKYLFKNHQKWRNSLFTLYSRLKNLFLVYLMILAH